MEKEKMPVENDNLEDAEKSLKLLREEKESQKKQSWLVRAWTAFKRPFCFIGRSIGKLFKKIRLPITAKTTIIYTTLFVVALALTVAFMISSINRQFTLLGVESGNYIDNLIITGILLILIDVALVASLGGVASRVMMSPVRKMIKKIDEIDPDDLSTRLEKVDRSGEIGELTDRINEMLDKIEQSLDRQKKFVSDASHELKTPVAVIQGYSNMLRRWGKEDPAVLDESIEAISREAENMQRIIEQLLFLAKLGRFVMTVSEVELKNEFRAITESYALLYPQREFRFECSAKVVNAETDKNLLTECVRAIVDNAVKYSADDSLITIRLNKVEDNAEISIIDNGSGISKEDLPHIFDRFYRCDKSRHRSDGKSGYGLGLTIAKSIVEMMNGRIYVESEKDKGSTFTIIFPLKEIKNE